MLPHASIEVREWHARTYQISDGHLHSKVCLKKNDGQRCRERRCSTLGCVSVVSLVSSCFLLQRWRDDCFSSLLTIDPLFSAGALYAFATLCTFSSLHWFVFFFSFSFRSAVSSFMSHAIFQSWIVLDNYHKADKGKLRSAHGGRKEVVKQPNPLKDDLLPTCRWWLRSTLP